MELSKLEKYQEGNRLEVKSARGGLPSVWDSISAFANTDGGIIVLGVKENTKTHELFVTGVPDAHKTLEDFLNAAGSSDKLSLNMFDDSNAYATTINGRSVVVIEVPRVNRRFRPVFTGPDPFRGTYRRKFTGDYHCTPEEVRAMYRDSAETSLDAEVAENSTIEGFDKNTLRAYRSLFSDVHKSGMVRDMPDDEFLCQIGAAKEVGGEIKPTKAGVLMFGKEYRIAYEYPNYFLDYRRELGGSRRWDDRITSQEVEWSGNIFDFYNRVELKLRQALDVPFNLNENMRRVDDTPAHEAMREALINCLTNADFDSSRGVVVRWTNVGLEFLNPGSFRIGILRAFKGGTSDARNKNLLKMFSLVKIGERAGSGVPNMVDQWMSCNHGKPVLSESYGPEVSTVLLPFSADSDNDILREPAENIVRIGRKQSNQTRKNEVAIVAYLTEHGDSQSADIAKNIGLGISRTNQLLRSLVEGGMVDAVGGSRNRIYRLSE